MNMNNDNLLGIFDINQYDTNNYNDIVFDNNGQTFSFVDHRDPLYGSRTNGAAPQHFDHLNTGNQPPSFYDSTTYGINTTTPPRLNYQQQQHHLVHHHPSSIIPDQISISAINANNCNRNNRGNLHHNNDNGIMIQTMMIPPQMPLVYPVTEQTISDIASDTRFDENEYHSEDVPNGTDIADVFDNEDQDQGDDFNFMSNYVSNSTPSAVVSSKSYKNQSSSPPPPPKQELTVREMEQRIRNLNQLRQNYRVLQQPQEQQPQEQQPQGELFLTSTAPAEGGLHHDSSSSGFASLNNENDDNEDSQNEDESVTEQGDEDDDLQDEHPRRLDPWTVRYYELRDFHRKFGHSIVPHNYKPNLPLAQWVKRQRHQRKRKLRGEHSTITSTREKLLDRLNFVWNAHAVAWEERWHELLEFKAEHGHCNVPSNFPENPKLSVWVKSQRRLYKTSKQEGKPLSPVNKKRCERLDKIGFDWNPRNL